MSQSVAPPRVKPRGSTPTCRDRAAPLPPELASSMERRFGFDFSAVRIHTGKRAEMAAEAMGARAFTLGGMVGFAAGQWAPGSPAGDRLLAHELAHVVQQSRGGGAAETPALEHAAAAASEAAVAGLPAAVEGGARLGVAREGGGLSQLGHLEGKYPHQVTFKTMDEYAASDATNGVQGEDGVIHAVVFRSTPPSALIPVAPIAAPKTPRPAAKPKPAPTPEKPVDIETLRDIAEALQPRLTYPKPVRQLGGAVQMLGGGLEAAFGGIGGLATAETGVGLAAGGFLLLHGADQASSGWTTMMTGEGSRTYTFRLGAGAAKQLGADRKMQAAVGQSFDTVANLGAAGISLGMAARPISGLGPEGGGLGGGGLGGGGPGGGLPEGGLPGGGEPNPFAGLTEAEIDAAVTPTNTGFRYRVPVDVSENPARTSFDDLVPVTRWGRSGLEPGDWVMPGDPTRGNYGLSFKWDPNPLNKVAPFQTGQPFLVPPETVRWPTGWGLDGWWKGLFTQRRYVP